MFDIVSKKDFKGITQQEFSQLFEEYLHKEFISEEEFGILIT